MALDFDSNDTLGAAFIGYSISCIIFGIFTTQTISFYHRYRADPLSLKIVVGVVWVTEFIHQIFIAHALYYYTISLFGTPIAVFVDPAIWSMVTQVLVAIISATIVKSCFVIRVWRFSHHNKVVTAVLAVVVLVTLASTIAFAVQAYHAPTVFDIAKLKGIGSTALASGALADFLIAVTLCYYLQKLRTGYKEPDSLLNSLVQYALNTGALTSILSITTLILYDTRTMTFQYMGVYFVFSKMFAVSLMCALSTRKQVTGAVGDEFTQTNGGFGALSMNVNHIEPNYIRTQTMTPDFSMELGNQWYAVDQPHPHGVGPDKPAELAPPFAPLRRQLDISNA